MALRLSEGLGSRAHMLEQIDICWLVAKPSIEPTSCSVVPENVKRYAVQAQDRDFLLQGFEGPTRVALAAVFRLDLNVEYVGDGETELRLHGEPKTPYGLGA